MKSRRWRDGTAVVGQPTPARSACAEHRKDDRVSERGTGRPRILPKASKRSLAISAAVPAQQHYGDVCRVEGVDTDDIGTALAQKGWHGTLAKLKSASAFHST